MCIVESWLGESIADNEVSLPGYSIARLDRNRHGGGILIYMKCNLSFRVVLSGPSDLELIFVSVQLSCKNKSLLLGTFYRQPSSHVAIFDSLFDDICSLDVSYFSNFILLGDFNVDMLSPSSLCYHLNSILHSFSLVQVVTEPTHIKHD